MNLDLTQDEADFLASAIDFKESEGFYKGEEEIANKFKDHIHDKFPEVAHEYWYFCNCSCSKKEREADNDQ